MKKILDSVIKKILPAKTLVPQEFVTLFSTYVSGKILLGGSYAKNTHIGHAFDCDVFVQFPSEKEIPTLKKSVLAFSKKHDISCELVHGSRDYFRLLFKGIVFEIIPVVNIKNLSDATNVMDHSPFHVAWFQKAKGVKYANDIRLLKQFMKSARVYGAESYINGFSGHVVDILVLHYKGFIPAIKAIARWKKTTDKGFKKIIIDYSKAYTGKDVLFYMNESKTHSPLIVIDPILPERNAAAAVSKEKYDQLINLAKSFVKKPSEKNFTIQEISADVLKKNYKKPIAEFIVIPMNGEKDIVGTKLLKAVEFISQKLQDAGFTVIASDWKWNGSSGINGLAHFYFVVESLTIPKKYIHYGPPNNLPEAVLAFTKKYPASKVKNGVCVVSLERKYTAVADFVLSLGTTSYIQSKIASISLKK